MLAAAEFVAFAATSDPDRARRFYGDALGLPLLSADPFALVFDAGGTTLRVTRVERVVPAPYTVLGWRVPDLGAAMRELAAHDVAVARYPALEQDTQGVWTAPGGARIAWFRDPDGNVLSLTEAR